VEHNECHQSSNGAAGPCKKPKLSQSLFSLDDFECSICQDILLDPVVGKQKARELGVAHQMLALLQAPGCNSAAHGLDRKGRKLGSAEARALGFQGNDMHNCLSLQVPVVMTSAGLA
jgi:hypothetical protein